jgi:hypothetical protein
LRIVDIHLATIGLDVQLARRSHGTFKGGVEMALDGRVVLAHAARGSIIG